MALIEHADKMTYRKVEAEEASITQKLKLALKDYNPQPIRPIELGNFKGVREHPGVSNPVIKASQVDDYANPDLVADPFINYIPEDDETADPSVRGKYVIVAEVKNTADENTNGVWTSPDGLNWSYSHSWYPDTTVNLSFPHCFKWNGQWYYIPMLDTYALNIYKLAKFPPDDSGDVTLVDNPFDNHFGDPQPFYWDGRWWIAHTSHTTPKNIRLHYSEPTVGGPENLSWTEHPDSPIVATANDDKGGGRPIVTQHGVFLPIQDPQGVAVSIYKLTNITTSSVTVTKSVNNIISMTSVGTALGGWRQAGMHMFDMVRGGLGADPIIVCDGKIDVDNMYVGILTFGGSGWDTKFCKRPSSDLTDIDSGVKTPILLDGQGADYGDHYDDANKKYVIPSSGLWEISGSVWLHVDTANAPYRVDLYVDELTEGETKIRIVKFVQAQAAESIQIPPRQIYLNEGEEIQLAIEHQSGSDTGTSVGGTYYWETWLSIKKVD